MRIGVSGTPGTGKTTYAKKLAEELKLEYIGGTEFARKHKLDKEFDHERNCFVVDTDKINQLLQDKDNFVFDSHFAHDIAIDKCYICTCQLPVLKKRLEERNYDEKKVRENLDAEIFQVCYVEAVDNGLEPIKVDCTK